MTDQWKMAIPALRPDYLRRITICTPPSYEEEPERRYPVLYMFDGQNLFHDEEASFGKSWNMATFVEENDPDCIIVGMESSPFGNERLCEYSPFSHNEPELGPVHGVARTTMEWLLDTLKPRVDAQYRTLPDREHTYAAGSSMGGLMSLFAVTDYNEVFSRAACLSPSLWVHPSKVHRMVAGAKMEKHTLVYMDYGSEELGNHGANYGCLLDTFKLLLDKEADVTFRLDPYGDHSEASWESRVPVFMRCLYLA